MAGICLARISLNDQREYVLTCFKLYFVRRHQQKLEIGQCHLNLHFAVYRLQETSKQKYFMSAAAVTEASRHSLYER